MSEENKEPKRRRPIGRIKIMRLPTHIEAEVDEKVYKKMDEMGVPRRGRGTCHFFWSLKKEILRNEYGIDWKSPRELNPHVKFD